MNTGTTRKFSLTILCFLMVFMLSAVINAQEKKEEQVPANVAKELENIKQYYQKAGNFKVDFTQIYHSRITKRTKESSGQVDFAKPMKMRWEYQKPERKSFITNGKSLWVATWENKEVKVHKDLKSSDLESSLAFLWGGENLALKYKVAKLMLPNVEGIVDVKNRLLLELIPREKSQFDTLYLLVNSETFRIEEVVLVDLIGNLNHITFTSPQTAQKFPKGHFVFTMPAKDWVETRMDF